MAEALDSVFGWICHQIPTRSPQAGEHVFPLCYRCAGLYLGLFAGYASWALRGFPGARRDRVRVACMGLLGLPFVMDAWAGAHELWVSPGWMRALTGLALGVSLPAMLSHLRTGGRADGLNGWRILIPALAPGVFLLFALETLQTSAVHSFLAVAAACGLVAFLSNIVAIAGMPRRFRDVSRTPSHADAMR